MLFEHAPTGMLVLDDQGAIQFVNHAAAELLNWSAQQLIGEQLGVPTSGDQPAELEIHRGNGEMGIAELRTKNIQWKTKLLFLITFHDVTERKKAIRTIRHQALHDRLTNLPNRLQMQERLKEALDRASLEVSHLAVLFIDLDKFKDVNDTLGHAAGDKLLRLISGRLSNSLRSSDLVARMGGDEFAVVLEGIKDRQAVSAVAEKLRKNVSEPTTIDGESIFPACTIGISFFPDDGEDVQTLLMRADTAMYQGKESGRNRSQSFSIAEEEDKSRRFRLDQALSNAWQDGGFFVVYQPLITLPDQRLYGAEALLRCRLPEFGLVSPEEFIPLLEDNGLIHEVGEWVFREVAQLLSANGQQANMLDRVWVNVSAKQLFGDKLIESLDRLIDESRLDPHRVGIELTESCVAGDIDHTRKIVRELSERGFLIAMDDFGTGFSSLSYLHQLDFDVVKVDKSFVQRLSKSSEARQLVRAILAMGHTLNLSVLAEGVETEEQIGLLIEDGFDFAQGYLFSRPVPSDDIQLATKDAPLRAECFNASCYS